MCVQNKDSGKIRPWGPGDLAASAEPQLRAQLSSSLWGWRGQRWTDGGKRHKGHREDNWPETFWRRSKSRAAETLQVSIPRTLIRFDQGLIKDEGGDGGGGKAAAEIRRIFLKKGPNNSKTWLIRREPTSGMSFKNKDKATREWTNEQTREGREAGRGKAGKNKGEINLDRHWNRKLLIGS